MDSLNTSIERSSVCFQDAISPLVTGSIAGDEAFGALYDGFLRGSLTEPQKEIFAKTAVKRVRRMVKKRMLDSSETEWFLELSSIPIVRGRIPDIANQVELMRTSLQQARENSPSY